jgi:hypothetical protein
MVVDFGKGKMFLLRADHQGDWRLKTQNIKTQLNYVSLMIWK